MTQQLLSLLLVLLEDLLGKYRFVNGEEKPSIRVVPPQIPPNIEFKPESGIECLIYETPDTKSQSQSGSVILLQEYKFILLQRKTNESLKIALERIAYCFPGCKIKPVPQMPTDEGLVYEKATVSIDNSQDYSDPDLLIFAQSVVEFVTN